MKSLIVIASIVFLLAFLPTLHTHSILVYSPTRAVDRIQEDWQKLDRIERVDSTHYVVHYHETFFSYLSYFLS